jgi:hypothetical protein
MTHPLEALSTRHATLPPGTYATLANVRCIDRSPFAVAEGVTVRYADSDERSEIEHLLRAWGPDNGVMPQSHTVGINMEEPGVTWSTATAIPADQVRFPLIDVAGSNRPVYTLQRASCLTLKPVELGIHVSQKVAGFEIGGGYDLGLARVAGTFMNKPESVFDLNATDLAELRDVYGRLALIPESEQLQRTIEQFLQLRRIPESMPIRFLGSFAILESLLTRNPRDEDPMSSLGYQIRTKMQLLERRFVHAVAYPRNLESSKYWSKMYSHRSAIAHGNFAAMDKPPKEIGSTSDALAFVEGIVSRVMRVALDEPQLMADLKVC